MRTIRPSVVLVCAVVAALAAVFGKSASAEKPNMAPQALRKVATHIVVGEVKAIYSRVVREGDWEVRKFVAEVIVEDVEKGDGVAKGSLAYVRYWQTWWLGRPNEIPPGTGGHRGVPKEGDHVRIYLARNAYDGFTDDNKDGGFNVIGSNGFEVPLPPAPTGPALSGWLSAKDNLRIGVRIYEGEGDQKKPYGVVIRFVGQNSRVIVRYTGGEMDGVEDSLELSAPSWARRYVRRDDPALK
jgi:hypothetical protein